MVDSPHELPPEVRSTIESCSPDELRAIADYATELAQRRETTNEDDETDTDQTEEMPNGVPSKATITTKEINGNRYHYWQWREGDKIRSKYKGPASDAE